MGAEWLLSASQIRELLGHGHLPLRYVGPGQREESKGPRPTQEHLDA